MRIVESHAKGKGLLRKDKITQGWWRNFVSRQGDLSLRKGDNTAHITAKNYVFGHAVQV